MNEYKWSDLNSMQVGRYAEYFVKMEFTMYGFEVYTSEVDDRCVDFVVRKGGGPFYDVQVKSIRERSSYIFVRKDHFGIADNRLVAVVLFRNGDRPDLFIIPMNAWNNLDPLLRSRDYKGKKSKPEWGINVSARNRPLLEKFRFESWPALKKRNSRGAGIKSRTA